MKTQSISIDWSNVDLTDSYQRDQNILDPYDFDTLLLEISCNLRKEELTREGIGAHFNEVLCEKVRVAKEVFKDNLDNIIKEAIKERNQ